MALVKAVDDHGIGNLAPQDAHRKRNVRHKDSDTEFDYECLQKLCSIKGLGTVADGMSTDQAHWEFMQCYNKIFLNSKHHRPSEATFDSLSKRPAQCSRTHMSLSSDCSGCHASRVGALRSADSSTSSCSNFPRLRVRKQSPDEAEMAKRRMANFALLRKLLRKFAVDRTREENHKIFTLLRKVSEELRTNCEPNKLKELCVVAHLDVWDEPGIAIDAEDGFFFILSGSVRTSTLSLQGSLARDLKTRRARRLPQDWFSSSMLVVGDSFGVLGKTEDDHSVTRVRSVCTVEPCELLVITSTDHERVIQKMKHKHELEKLGILEGCKMLEDWPRQPLNTIASLLKLTQYQDKVVLAREGEMAEFIAFVRTGTCHVLCHVDAIVTLPNNIQEHRRRTIEMCRIGPFESFGEESLLFSQPMTYTVVTSGPVELALIEKESLSTLDPVILQLFRHSSEKMSRKISKKTVEDEYVNQEKKNRWEQMKANVLSDSLRYCGIQPGVGKWKK